MSKFTLKNVKFFPSLSEETNCFQTNIYYDNVLIGMADNHGKGGSTNVILTPLKNSISDKQSNTITAAAREVHSLLELDPTKYQYQSVMESIVDELFEGWLKEDHKKKVEKIISIKSINHLIFEDTDENIFVIKYSPSIESWLSKNPTRIKEVIKDHISKGSKLLNNNIPESIIN